MKKLQRLLFFSILAVLIVSCSPVAQSPLKPLDPGASKTVGKQYAPKVDNFVVLLDASLSMNENGKNDFVVAREIVNRINQGIPTDLNYNAGLRSVGHHSYQSEESTTLLYGMTTYNQTDFHEGLNKIKYVGGTTPMSDAIQAIGNDLNGATGKSAVIIVSDGLHIDDAPAAAEKLKEQMGENLCIYTVTVGNENNGAGQDMMKQLATIGGCGFATTDTELSDDSKMGSFIESVFITDAPPADTDGDGAIDDLDKCPNTPTGVAVDNNGCPLDDDGDGVININDHCPGTPPGVSVDAYGCQSKLTLQIHFGLDSTDIGADFNSEIDKIVQCSSDFPGNTITVNGYTDSTGSAAYNKKLSQQRADAIRNLLIEKYNIDESRIVAKGFGENDPIADNKTTGGRDLNRRVEVDCGATE
jgi:OOP family OmpA-OmpF porin